MATREYQALMRPDSELVSAAKKLDAELGVSGQSTLSVTLIPGIPVISSKISDIDTNQNFETVRGTATASSQTFQHVINVGPYGSSWWMINRGSGTDTVRIEIPNNITPHVAAK